MASATSPLRESPAAFKRVLLKLSGEALMGDQAYGVDPKRIESLSREIVEVHRSGVEIALVIGAGNIIRGMEAAATGMDRATADYAGMLATVLNSLTVQDALERRKAQTRVMSAIEVAEVAEPYIRRRAIRHLEKGRIVIFAAGTGQPVLHDGHRRGTPSPRDRRRGDPDGEERRPRRLRRRPEARP